MKIIYYSAGQYYHLRLEGDLDVDAAIQLDQVMQKAVGLKPSAIWIDCKELHYISSAGLGVFISYLQKMEDHQITLRLYNMQENIREIFQLTGLDKIINILPMPAKEGQSDMHINATRIASGSKNKYVSD